MTGSTRPRNLNRSTSTRACLLLLAAASATMSAGCNRDDTNSELIRTTSAKLDLISMQGANPFPVLEKAESNLRDVISKLQPVTTGGTGAEQAAASLLTARSQGMLGEISATRAFEAERAFLSRLGILRATLDQWGSQHAVASTLDSYDPTKDVQEFDKQIGERSKDLQSLQTQVAAQQAIVDDLKARSDAAKSGARAERDRETTLRRMGEGASQTARFDMVRQAVEISRNADRMEREASELQAQAEKEGPKVAELKNQMERFKRQVELLNKSKKEATDRAATNKRQAAAAREDAAKAGSTIGELVKELSDRRSAIAGPTQEALKQYGASATAARSGAKSSQADTKSAASIMLGIAQQSVGDVNANKSRSLEKYAAILEQIATTSPAISSAGGAGEQGKKLAEEAKAAKDEAMKSYAAAKDAYASARGSADLKPRLERLTQSIGKLLGLPTEKPAEAPTETPAPASDAAPAEEAAPKPGAGG